MGMRRPIISSIIISNTLVLSLPAHAAGLTLSYQDNNTLDTAGSDYLQSVPDIERNKKPTTIPRADALDIDLQLHVPYKFRPLRSIKTIQSHNLNRIQGEIL